MLLMGVVHGRLAGWLDRPVLTAHTMMFAAPTYVGQEVEIRLVPEAGGGPERGVQTDVIHPAGTLGLTGRATIRTDGRYPPLPAYVDPVGDQRVREALGMAPGQFAMRKRRFVAGDVRRFAALIDDPGLPPDQVPPALLGGLISDLLGTTLPGPGTNWLKLTLHLGQAVNIGDPLTGQVTVTRLRPKKALVNLRTTVHAADNTLVADGEALVLVRDVAT
jgi:hypothetical protein